MHRFRVFGLTLLLALMGIGVMAAPASAAVPDGFTRQNNGVWVDDNCDNARGTADHRFEVKIAKDENGGGANTEICSSWSTFCDVPLTPSTYIVICNMVGNGTTANDQVSSVYSIWIQTGWDVCLYTAAGYAGSKLRLTNNYADVGALGDFSDKFSAIRARQEGTSC